MQAALEAARPKLQEWFNGHTQSMHLKGQPRKLLYALRDRVREGLG